MPDCTTTQPAEGLSVVSAPLALLQDARDEFAQHVWQREQAKVPEGAKAAGGGCTSPLERQVTGSTLLHVGVLQRCWERWVRLTVATGRVDIARAATYEPTFEDLDHFITYNFHIPIWKFI